MASSISHGVSSILFDAAVKAIAQLGLKNPDIVASNIAASLFDDAADQHDDAALDCSFYGVISALGCTAPDLRDAYAVVCDARHSARLAADKAAAIAQAAADKAAKIADLKKQLADLA